ncbi:CDP-alcohol phosphatidyltransferase family protein [Roseibium marinum]|uniref:Phosphatidylglycerophosphate synthase n=1 Tax=Roseibium marinum TaxID=281252 RepID=A0A2S3UQ77_9HYPH|nr:phosphatidylglycerophosphate synthase [Roseibium marinum]
MGSSFTNLPNALSLSRIPAAVIFLVVYSDEDLVRMALGLAVLAYAFLSDILDGYIARNYVGSTITGYFLDGLGDRAVYVAVLLTIVRIEPSQSALAWILIFREIAIYALRALDPDKQPTLKKLRSISIAQAVFIRLYFGGFFVATAVALVEGDDIPILNFYILLGIVSAIVGCAGVLAHTVILVRTSDGRR